MSKTLSPKLLRLWAPITADAAGTDAAPKWNMIFPRGVRFRADFPPGGINFDDKYFAAIIGNWKLNGGQPMAIDYSHALDDMFAPASEQDAAGWMLDLKAEADGLYALCDWTDVGRAKILSKERGGISPTWIHEAIHPMTGQSCGPMLMHAGLVNNPFFADMPRVAASATAAPPLKGADEMNPKIRAALKLPDDCTQEAYDAAILAALEPKEEAPPAPSEEEMAASLSAKVEVITKPLHAKIEEMGAKLASLTAANVALETEKRKASVAAVMEKHKRRFVAAQRDDVQAMLEAMGLEKGEKLLASWPFVVPATDVEVGVTGGVDADDARQKFSAAVDSIAKERGIDRSAAHEVAILRHSELYAAASRVANPAKP